MLTVSLKFSVIPHCLSRSQKYLPFKMGATPLAKHSPPNLLLKTLLASSVAEAPFVISMPAAMPSKIRFRRRTGWLCVLINTPACAFRKMSFSSRIPDDTTDSHDIFQQIKAWIKCLTFWRIQFQMHLIKVCNLIQISLKIVSRGRINKSLV